MADLERRVAELEEQLRTRRIDMKQLPLTALKNKLTGELKPDGDTFLLPKSVGNDSLEDNAVDDRVLGLANSGFLATYGSGAVQGTGASTWWWVKMGAKTAESSAWFNTANGRYTPQEAGWYVLSTVLHSDTPMLFNDDVMWQAGIYKNGAAFKSLGGVTQARANQPRTGGSIIVWANGTTDYFMPMFWHNDSIGHGIHATTENTWFTGAKVLSP